MGVCVCMCVCVLVCMCVCLFVYVCFYFEFALVEISLGPPIDVAVSWLYFDELISISVMSVCPHTFQNRR